MSDEKMLVRVGQCRQEIAWIYLRMQDSVINGNEFGIAEGARQILKLTAEIIQLLYPSTIQAIEAKNNG